MSIALCYYDLGFYEDAENSYREAIKSNPKPMHINTEITHVDSMKIGIVAAPAGWVKALHSDGAKSMTLSWAQGTLRRPEKSAENYMRTANQTYSNITGA